MGFRIELPAYRGPLDLLLYLVRRNEIPSGELSLSKVIDQYVRHIDAFGGIDGGTDGIDLAEVGDFIDLASVLLEIKSQAVLPQIVEEEDEEAINDPQEELVERLLQYKQIRDAAAVLEEMGQRWQRRYERMSDDLPRRRLDPGDQPIVDLEIWDLVSAFGRIMREAAGPPPTQVIYDETPIHVYMQKIHEGLRLHERLPLIDLLTGGSHKSALIGWFLATLELTRHHGAAIEQDDRGDIFVVRTAQFREDLDVAQVDNYSADAIDSSNMPVRMR